MNWTFNIIKKTKTDDNTLEIVVGFDNGTKQFQRIFYATRENLSRAWLEQQIKQEVEIFEKAKSFVTGLQTGTFTLTPDTTPEPDPTPEPPTQEELDKQAYFSDFAKLQQIQTLIDVGVLTGSETAVTTLRNKVKNEFKIEYLN